jgi:hypothetical protein
VCIGKKRTDILLRKKMHIVTGSPFFSYAYQEGIKHFFVKEKMKKGSTRMNFDGKVPIGCGEVATLTDPYQFGKKL